MCCSIFFKGFRNKDPISFLLSMENSYRIKPNEITLSNYIKYLNNSWDSFYKIKQKLW